MKLKMASERSSEGEEERKGFEGCCGGGEKVGDDLEAVRAEFGGRGPRGWGGAGAGAGG